MIPKKIHYCWLSGEEMPAKLKDCLNSWQEVMPEYEIVCWDKNRFDISSQNFVKEACNAKKWAFAADYIRLYALYTEGGIYLDSDVLVLKKFDDFLQYDFFTSVEFHTPIVEYYNTLSLLNSDGSSKIKFTPKPGIGIQAAVLGSVKNNPFIQCCMDYYKDKHFTSEQNGKKNTQQIAPEILAITAERFGFKYINKLQKIGDNMLILPSDIFAGNLKQKNENSYAIHYCEGSWKEKQPLSKRIVGKLKRTIVIRYNKIFIFTKNNK
jgi:mannosyltransferase OCH1-like enzyme